jgi:competence protein ComEA
MIALVALLVCAEPVDVNDASKELIEAVPGIGAKAAAEIVRERELNGPFASVDDLVSRVPSLGPVAQRKAASLLSFASPAPTPSTSSRPAASAADVARALAHFRDEPAIRDVQVAALDYARVHPEVVDGWMLRARVRAAAPQLLVQGETGVDDNLKKITNLDATSPEIDALTNGGMGKLTVAARWDLDRLVFEPEEMIIARESVRTAALRDRVLEDVTRRYFERRRVEVELFLAPPTDLGERIKIELRIDELAADLDALTGGFFSQHLASGASRAAP